MPLIKIENVQSSNTVNKIRKVIVHISKWGIYTSDVFCAKGDASHKNDKNHDNDEDVGDHEDDDDLAGSRLPPSREEDGRSQGGSRLSLLYYKSD